MFVCFSLRFPYLYPRAQSCITADTEMGQSSICTLLREERRILYSKASLIIKGNAFLMVHQHVDTCGQKQCSCFNMLSHKLAIAICDQKLPYKRAVLSKWLANLQLFWVHYFFRKLDFCVEKGLFFAHF